jgi:superoxide reductase
MKKMDEQTADWETEKHVPVIKQEGNLITVTVGSTPHPMTDEHYIEWIELVADGRMQRKFLKPGDPPEAQFLCGADKLSAREYCNLHGLWKN